MNLNESGRRSGVLQKNQREFPFGNTVPLFRLSEDKQSQCRFDFKERIKVVAKTRRNQRYVRVVNQVSEPVRMQEG